MITHKLDIFTNKDDTLFILNKQKQYSYAFRKLYKYYSKINDMDYLNSLRIKYDLSAYLLNCLVIDVKTKFEQIKTQKTGLENRILSITNEIEKLNLKPDRNKKETKQLFKLNKLLKHKNKMLGKEITFGGLKLLKRLSYLNNNKELNENDKELNKNEIEDIKKEYRNKRVLGIYYVGSLNDPNSNRYFDFDFINNKIIYKPYQGKKIEINYIISNKVKKQLLKLQEIKDLKVSPITVRLTNKQLTISYDEEIVNGYGFKGMEFKKEISKIDKNNKELRHEIAIKYKQEQSERKLRNKISKRFCSIDLNPEYIGVAVFDKTDDNGNLKLISEFCYDLRKLLNKSNKDSSDSYSEYLVNKRKYEIGVIYANLFRTIKHLNCAYFVMEDLNFKSDNINNNSKEGNRKTKNVWNLNYQTNLINKHCNINGITLREVNPCYSSFIGNLMYKYFDPVNAAIEIGRRGMMKYEKGCGLYPQLSDTIIDTALASGLSDVQLLKAGNWIELFRLFKEAGIKYRWQLEDTIFSCSSKFNIKSNWNLIRF